MLIDCPPSLGLLTVNALVAADHALLTAEAQYFALQGVEQALEVIELARDGLNPDLDWLGVVFNIADMRTVHSREAFASLREHVGEKLFATTIRQSIAYAESAERAVSILDHRPDLGADYLRARRRAARPPRHADASARRLAVARRARRRRALLAGSPAGTAAPTRLQARAQATPRAWRRTTPTTTAETTTTTPAAEPGAEQQGPLGAKRQRRVGPARRARREDRRDARHEDALRLPARARGRRAAHRLAGRPDRAGAGQGRLDPGDAAELLLEPWALKIDLSARRVTVSHEGEVGPAVHGRRSARPAPRPRPAASA